MEKPFGKDLCSSEALAEDIAKYYPEEQVGCRTYTHKLFSPTPLAGPTAGLLVGTAASGQHPAWGCC